MADDGTEGSLTHDEALERLFELTRQGRWQVGSNIVGRTFIDVYRRSDGYYLLRGGPTTDTGFRTIRRDLPATLVALTEPAEVLGHTAGELLEALDLSPEVPVERSRFPVVRQAKARSWLDLVRTSATVGVVRLGDVYAVSTWVRDPSRLDGVQIVGKHGHAVLQSPSSHDLGEALRIAADAVQP